MVQWMRHRRPQYIGGAKIEVERPSASYIVDVCPTIDVNLDTTADLSLEPGPASACKAQERCGCCSCETLTLLPEQAQAPNQHRTMDP